MRILRKRLQVAVVGASGGIGQPLSMLLKLDNAVTELSLYDIVHTPGVAADLSHIPTKGKVVGHKGACVRNIRFIDRIDTVVWVSL